jgi:hypothetical protein
MLRVGFFLVWKLYQARKGKDKRDQLPQKASTGAESNDIQITMVRMLFWIPCYFLSFQSESIPILLSIG